MFTLNNTPEALHSWVFYKSFGSFFICVFTFSCKQLCDKCLQRVLKVRCALGVQRSAVTHFLHSVCFYFCHVPFCEGARRRRRGGWRSRQIQECSLNVPWGETVTRSAGVCVCVDRNEVSGVDSVFIFIFFWSRLSVAESFCSFAFSHPPHLFYFFFLAWLFCTGKTSMLSSHSTWFVGSESGVST